MAQAAHTDSEPTLPLRLTNWNVRRSGAGMTVDGVNDYGRRVTLTGFDRIEPGGGYAIAIKAEDTVDSRVILV